MTIATQQFSEFWGDPQGTSSPSRFWLPGLNSGEIQLRKAMLDRNLQDLARFYPHRHSGKRQLKPSWRIDPFPASIDPEDWSQLSRATLQWLATLDHYTRDIFGPQDILSRKIMPPGIAFDDPAYCLELATINFPHTGNILVGSVDFIQDVDGGWNITDQNVTNPEGLTQSLQSRRLLAQFLPELFHNLRPVDIAPSPAHLMEALLTECGDQHDSQEPSIAVMLCQSNTGHFRFEESFLARQMGIPMVKAGDLVVREQHLYLRTIAGLRLVQTVFRHVPGRELDPVSIPGETSFGIPGLIHCFRAGNVKILNTPGTDAANGRSLLRYQEVLTRFYMEELPVIPAIPTLVSQDRDQREFALDNADAHIFRHPYPQEARLSESWNSAVSPLDFRNQPFVAHPKFDRRRTRRWSHNDFQATPFRVRLFGVLLPTPWIMPGGLVFLDDQEEINPDKPGPSIPVIRDLWIDENLTGGSSSQPGKSSKPPHTLRIPRLHLASRVAEDMYWMGRYLERAETLIRQVAIFVEAWQGQETNDSYQVLFEVLHRCAEIVPDPGSKPQTHGMQLAARLLLDTSAQGSSAYANFNQACDISIRLSGSLSPEFAHSMQETLRQFNRGKSRAGSNPADMENQARILLGKFAELFGVAFRTLTRDNDWRFFQAGTWIERANLTALSLGGLLDMASRIPKNRLQEETPLLLFLRAMASLDAFSRQFRARATITRVFQLFWKQGLSPSSLDYAVLEIENQLRAITASGNLATSPLLKQLKQTRALLEAYPWGTPEKHPQSASSFAIDATECSRALDNFRNHLNRFHVQMESFFFSHNATH